MSANGKCIRQGWQRQSRNLESDAVKAAIHELDLRNALTFYGVQFNKHGAALCPFHKEKTASFRVKGKYWHCFGCGNTGDLIKFVRLLFDASYAEALDMISKDFNINKHFGVAEQFRLDKLRLERYNNKRRFEKLLTKLDEATTNYWYAYDVSRFIAVHCGESVDNDTYAAAQFALLRAKFALEEAEYNCAQYLRENPDATPVPPSSSFIATNIILPPAPSRRVTDLQTKTDLCQGTGGDFFDRSDTN